MFLVRGNYKNKPLSLDGRIHAKISNGENPSSRYDPTLFRPLASDRLERLTANSLSLPFAPNQKVVTRAALGTRRGEHRALRINARREPSCNAIIARYRSSDL